MQGIIGDLLDARTRSVSPEPSEAGDLVEQARRAFLSSGNHHGIGLDIAPDLPLVMAGRLRMVQVFDNLFFNAARHAPQSWPIRVTAVREEDHVAVTVASEGRNPGLLRSVSSKHGRAGEGWTETFHGLELAICKGLVEAHGGRIRVESDDTGHGTVVTFTLPVAGETAPLVAGPP